MSRLYGSLQGCRGEATRTGSKDSGIRASVQSWDGSLCVFMDLNDDDLPVVEIQISDGSSCYGKTYFRGSLDKLKKILEEENDL
jgi:hypothetical protein